MFGGSQSTIGSNAAKNSSSSLSRRSSARARPARVCENRIGRGVFAFGLGLGAVGDLIDSSDLARLVGLAPPDLRPAPPPRLAAVGDGLEGDEGDGAGSRAIILVGLGVGLVLVGESEWAVVVAE